MRGTGEVGSSKAARETIGGGALEEGQWGKQRHPKKRDPAEDEVRATESCLIAQSLKFM